MSSWNQLVCTMEKMCGKINNRNQMHNQKVDWWNFGNFCILVLVDFGIIFDCFWMQTCSFCRLNMVSVVTKEKKKTIRLKWKCQFRKEVSEIAENQQSSTHRNYRKHMKSSDAIEIVSVNEWAPQKSKAKKKKKEKESTYKVFTAACLNRLWATNVN